MAEEVADKTVEEEVTAILEYHRPDEAGIAQITEIRKGAHAAIVAILHNCPRSADRSAAIRKIREGMMTANAAIVLEGRSL